MTVPAQPGGEPILREFASQGLVLRYREWGRADAQVAILIHGNRDHARSWDDTAALLADRWRVIVPDLRGHGDSQWSIEGRYDLAAYLFDLAALVDHFDAGPVTLVAHSMGAHVALRYAMAFPENVARIVAIEAVGAPTGIEAKRRAMHPARQLRAWIEGRRGAVGARHRPFAGLDDVTARFRRDHPFLSEGQAAHLARHAVREDGDGGWVWKFDPVLRVWIYPDAGPDDESGLWAAVTCPTLLLYGGKSWPSTLPEKLEASIPDVTVARFEEAGHWLHHDSFEAFGAVVLDFLAKE